MPAISPSRTTPPDPPTKATGSQPRPSPPRFRPRPRTTSSQPPPTASETVTGPRTSHPPATAPTAPKRPPDIEPARAKPPSNGPRRPATVSNPPLKLLPTATHLAPAQSASPPPPGPCEPTSRPTRNPVSRTLHAPHPNRHPTERCHSNRVGSIRKPHPAVDSRPCSTARCTLPLCPQPPPCRPQPVEGHLRQPPAGGRPSPVPPRSKTPSSTHLEAALHASDPNFGPNSPPPPCSSLGVAPRSTHPHFGT